MNRTDLITEILQVCKVSNFSIEDRNKYLRPEQQEKKIPMDSMFFELMCMDTPALIKIAQDLHIKTD